MSDDPRIMAVALAGTDLTPEEWAAKAQVWQDYRLYDAQLFVAMLDAAMAKPEPAAEIGAFVMFPTAGTPTPEVKAAIKTLIDDAKKRDRL